MEKQLIQIRDASSEDVPMLCALLGILFRQEADFAPDSEKQSRALHTILRNPTVGRLYCAEVKGAVVGMVSILFSVSTAEGGPVAWMEDLIVHPEHQSQGLGQKLTKRAIEGARAAGCTRITLLTDATNSSAISFYEQNGFVRSAMIPLRLHLQD